VSMSRTLLEMQIRFSYQIQWACEDETDELKCVRKCKKFSLFVLLNSFCLVSAWFFSVLRRPL
jgi:hypothetical protein